MKKNLLVVICLFATSIVQAQNVLEDQAIPTLAGRYVIGLDHHIPVKKNHKWHFLAHKVDNNQKSDRISDDTQWQVVVAEKRKIAKKIRRSRSPILVDFALVNKKHEKVSKEIEGETFYVIYNWTESSDKVDLKIK
jgi:oligoribonuclease NrnB/cAMP/cGMP phosphodiesterase (DHH superfamily)